MRKSEIVQVAKNHKHYGHGEENNYQLHTLSYGGNSVNEND